MVFQYQMSPKITSPFKWIIQFYESSHKLVPTIHFILFHNNRLRNLRHRQQYITIFPKANPKLHTHDFHIHKYIYFSNINVKRLFKKKIKKITSRPFILCICVAKLLVVFALHDVLQKSILYKNHEETSGWCCGRALFCLRWVFTDDNDGCCVETESRCDSVCSNRDCLRVNVLGLVIWRAGGLTLTDGELLQSAGRLLQCLIILSYAWEKKRAWFTQMTLHHSKRD